MLTSNSPLFPKRPSKRISLSAYIFNSKLIDYIFSFYAGKKKKIIPSDKTPVLQVDNLCRETLAELFNNEISAIHIPNYINKANSSVITKSILKKKLENWNVSTALDELKLSDVDVFGMPFSQALRTQSDWEKYFNNSSMVENFLNEHCKDHISPIRKFINNIEEVYSLGMKVREFHKFKMTPGVIRVMHAAGNEVKQFLPLNCHVDTLPLLSKNTGLYSVNIYFNVPSAGGEIFIWNPNFNSYHQLIQHWLLVKLLYLQQSYLMPELQNIIQESLPKPHKIKIKSGDLILFNTARPHAIGEFAKGSRVSYQAFLNFTRNNPIEIWA